MHNGTFYWKVRMAKKQVWMPKCHNCKMALFIRRSLWQNSMLSSKMPFCRIAGLPKLHRDIFFIMGPMENGKISKSMLSCQYAISLSYVNLIFISILCGTPCLTVIAYTTVGATTPGVSKHLRFLHQSIAIFPTRVGKQFLLNQQCPNVQPTNNVPYLEWS